MKKINKQKLLEIIKEWKISQKIIDYTDRSLINLAAKILDYQLKKEKNEEKN